MGQRLIITEEEKNNILSLYEQSEVQAAKIDNTVTRILPSTFVKDINNELSKSQELKSKINQTYNEQLPIKNPLDYLQSKGITPYLFLVPNYITGVGFPTTGLAVKIDKTPITISFNLGTNPKDIPSSLKFSRVSMNFPLTK